MAMTYEQIKDWDKDQWREWLERRLQGQDESCPYDEDEHPVDVVLDMVRQFPRGDAEESNLASAVAALLRDASPETTDLLVLSGLIELAANLPVRSAGQTIADWIERRVFLDERRPPVPSLHEALLYALAAMQRRRKPFRLEVAGPFLRRPSKRIRDEARLRQAARFMTAAFAAVALADYDVARKKLKVFLRNIMAIEDRLSRGVPIAPAVLALLTDTPKPFREIQLDIWKSLGREAPEKERNWARLRRAIQHTDYPLPSAAEMRETSKKASVVKKMVAQSEQTPGTVWDRPMVCSASSLAARVAA